MIVITNVGEIQIGPFLIGKILKSRNCAIFLLKLSVCDVSYVFFKLCDGDHECR